MKRTWIIGYSLLLFCTSIQAEQFRFVTFNIHEVGSPDSTEFVALSDIIGRLCPDVIVMQELVDYPDLDYFDSLAADTDYPYYEVSDISGTMSGTMWTACMSDHPIISAISWSSVEISGDSSANDICRDIFECRVSLPTGEAVGVITVHLKAYTTDTDKFRRQIEIIRLCQVIDRYRVDYPEDSLLIAGDFNADYNDGPFGSPTWTGLPSGLPSRFHLGNDIDFPITYDPFEPLLSRGLTMADATWEDSSTEYATYPSYDSRIDYVFLTGDLAVIDDEVYNSTRDDGEDDPPPGNWISKCGAVLPAVTSGNASDHLPIVADLQYSTALPSATRTVTPTKTPSPTGTPATSTPSFTPSPSGLPTSTPDLVPTPTETAPTPTPSAPWLGVRLRMPASYFEPGVFCWLTAIIGNDQSEPLVAVPLVVMLDLGIDVYWFWPSWSPWPDEFDFSRITVEPGETRLPIIAPFYWPNGAGDYSGCSFWGALLDQQLATIRGELGTWEFAFGY